MHALEPKQFCNSLLALPMAGLTIGGWFASATINRIADKVKSYLEDQWEYQFGVKAKLQKLDQHLTTIKAVIHVADKVQMENPGLSAWLHDLKDAVYAAEDVLDNVEYQILEDKVKCLNQVHNETLTPPCSLAKSAATTLFKSIVFCDEDLNEIDDVVNRFDGIVSSVGNFLELLKFDVGTRRRDLEWRLTTSTPIETKVVGREDEIANLVRLLIEREDEFPSSNQKFDVISIYGMGGVGKTTLAQAVYNNNKVKEFFDLRVWICVSDDFDLMRLTKEIIESASIRTPPNFHKFKNLDTVQGFLSYGLRGKRFLIVLDDVWNEVHTKWGILQTPFMCGQEQSQVIVTTRNQDIAKMMTTRKAIALEGLKGNAYQLFFTQCAFGSANAKDYPKLESIGREIASKLGGSPLASKTVGGILKHNLNEEHWREILQSNLWQLEQGEDGISPALRLSYEHLPAHLKQCFVYCSLFPKDFLFDRDELVRMWMAQGFILPGSGTKRAEDTGRDYFELLLGRSFFQHAVGRDDRYVVHDLMHDLAQSVSHDEYCIIKDAKPFEVPKRLRHLFFAADNANELLKNILRLKTLRSLIISRWRPDSRVLQDVIMKLKNLRVLVIQSWFIQLPEDLGHLTHLRYLSHERDMYHHLQGFGLFGSHTKEGYKSLSRLYHLQGLCLPNCDQLPKEINQLINLRYLNAPIHVVGNIPDIGRLTSLQELEEFHVKKERGYELKQLREMRQLGGRLRITNLKNVGNKDDIADSVLINKEHLTALELEWSSSGTSHTKPEAILESLRPHCNLKELKIIQYPNIKSPSWLDTNWLLYIETICLSRCKSWEVLPPLGQLHYLKVLQIIGMTAVRQIGHEFYDNGDAFPKLEELIFEDMWNLEKFSGPDRGCSFFPCLRKLHIRTCPKLEGPLPVTSLLKKLVITEECFFQDIQPILGAGSFVFFVDDISLLPMWLPAECLSNLQELEVREFLHEHFTEKQEDWFRQLISLKQLILSSCWGLTSLPAFLESLASLDRLLIYDCYEILSLPETGLPLSLKELHVNHCHPTLLQRCQKDSGPDWPKIAHIPTICIESRSVSSCP